MLLVGSILPAGSGAQLWQLDGAAPANIELNTSAGAAGILAEMPADNNFKLSLTDTNPDIPFLAGFIYHFDTVNNILSYVGVADFGVVTPSFGKRNVATDSAVNITAVSENVIGMRGDNIAGDSAGIFVANQNEVTQGLSNLSGVVGGGQKITLTDAKLTFHDNATNLLLSEFIVNSEFIFRDGAGADLLKVGAAGQLQTNQTAASIAVRVKVAEMPIYDQTGALVGYININT